MKEAIKIGDIYKCDKRGYRLVVDIDNNGTVTIFYLVSNETGYNRFSIHSIEMFIEDRYWNKI